MDKDAETDIGNYILLRGRCRPRDENWRRRMDKDRGIKGKGAGKDMGKGEYKEMDAGTGK